MPMAWNASGSTAGLAIGEPISGPGIPANEFITGVNGANSTITITTGTGVTAGSNTLAVTLLAPVIPVTTATSRVFGCSTKWIDKSDGARKQIEKWNQEPVSIEAIVPVTQTMIEELRLEVEKRLRLPADQKGAQH